MKKKKMYFHIILNIANDFCCANLTRHESVVDIKLTHFCFHKTKINKSQINGMKQKKLSQVYCTSLGQITIKNKIIITAKPSFIYVKRCLRDNLECHKLKEKHRHLGHQKWAHYAVLLDKYVGS